MSRPEKPITISDAHHAEFVAALRDIRRAAGSPSYRDLARRKDVHYSDAALRSAAAGNATRVPPWELTETYVRACGPEPISDYELWVYKLWKDARRARDPERPERARVEHMERLLESNGRALPLGEQPSQPSGLDLVPELPLPRSADPANPPPEPQDNGTKKQGWGQVGIVFLLVILLGLLIPTATHFEKIFRTPNETMQAHWIYISNSRPLRPGERFELVNNKVWIVAGSRGVMVPRSGLITDRTSRKSVSFTLRPCQFSNMATATLDLASWDRSERGWISFHLLPQRPEEVTFSAYDAGTMLTQTSFMEQEMLKDVYLRLDARALHTDSIRLVLSRSEILQKSDCEPEIVTASGWQIGS